MSNDGGILLCAPQASVSPSLQPGSEWTAIGLRCSETKITVGAIPDRIAPAGSVASSGK